MKLKTMQLANPHREKILLRVDFNVKAENGKVKEKFKINAVKETIEWLLERENKIALLSHWGRPSGKDKNFSLNRIKNDLERILNLKIKFVNDCLGEEVKKALDNLEEKEILLLENVRFYSEEMDNSSSFAQSLAENFNLFINDAFSVCHRKQASVVAITQFLPSFAGWRLQKEIKNLEKVREHPYHSAVAIIGGAKIDTKLPLIRKLEENYDFILVGGKVAIEAKEKNISFIKKVILPLDFTENKLDVGEKTIQEFQKIIAGARTIIWNGPMGKFEEKPYDHGTKEILKSIINNKEVFSLLGGGETLQLLEETNNLQKISFVSTGGGAMLTFLGKQTMPGLEVLKI